jgi:hypothetical protein
MVVLENRSEDHQAAIEEGRLPSATPPHPSPLRTFLQM